MPTSSALQPRNQIGNFQLGAGQTSGLQVLGQHTAGYIQGDHYLNPTLLDNLNVAAPLGPRQGDNDQGDTGKPQGQSYTACQAASRQAQTFDENRISDPAHRCHPPRPSPPQEEYQRGQRNQNVQELWRTESHGSYGILLNTVRERSTSSSNSANPGARNQAITSSKRVKTRTSTSDFSRALISA